MTGLWSVFRRTAAPLLLAGCAGVPAAPQLPQQLLLLEFLRTSGPTTSMKIGNVFKGEPASFESREQFGVFGDKDGRQVVFDCDQLARASAFAITKKAQTKDFSEDIYYTRQLVNFDVGRIWMRCPRPLEV